MVAWGDGGVVALIASPVRTRLLLLVNRLLGVVSVLWSMGVEAALGVVGILSRAVRRLDSGVYGYIRVRLQLLGFFLGFRMGRIGSILKIQ